MTLAVLFRKALPLLFGTLTAGTIAAVQPTPAAAQQPADVPLSAGGDVGLDAEAVRVATRMRFRPARVEGFPVPVWVALPIAVVFP